MRVTGSHNVEATAANAARKHVHSTTSTKITQTSLASQTGVVALVVQRAQHLGPRRTITPHHRRHAGLCG